MRRTKIDHLASKFENLRMEDESTASFVSKIRFVENEASVLEKNTKRRSLLKNY